MTYLWQNLHNFYVSKFPNLSTFTNLNSNQNEIQNETQTDLIDNQIDKITNLWNELYPRVYGYFYRRIDNQTAVEDLTASVLSSFLKNVENGKIKKNNFGYLW